MTTTGPLPAIRDSITGAQRMATLEHMGAFCEDVIPYGYVTADAVIDPCRGVLFIAADPEVDPGDWAAIVGLIHAVGWDNGSHPHSDDPGEPFWDALGGVCTWRLEYVRQCIWCDGYGVSYGCPLCERTRLR